VAVKDDANCLGGRGTFSQGEAILEGVHCGNQRCKSQRFDKCMMKYPAKDGRKIPKEGMTRGRKIQKRGDRDRERDRLGTGKMMEKQKQKTKHGQKRRRSWQNIPSTSRDDRRVVLFLTSTQKHGKLPLTQSAET
jgi:hypothetical protein